METRNRLLIEKLEQRIAPAAVQSCFIGDDGLVYHQVVKPDGSVHVNAMIDEETGLPETECPNGLERE
jgi:hypothetical protein